MKTHRWLKPLLITSTTALLTLTSLPANDFNNDGTSDILKIKKIKGTGYF